MARLDEARALTAELQVQLNKADDASNRAAIADTDEASPAFAAEAERTTRRLEADLAALNAILTELAFTPEQRALQDFQHRWSKFRSLDREILSLAVENTNLKAQHLLALALTEKPAVLLACDQSLQTLQIVLEKRGFKATR